MKKLLFLVSLIFTVMCYAAPPPEPVPVATDEVAYTADINQVVEISVPGIDVQEVTYCYIGNFEISSGTEKTEEPVSNVMFAEIPVVTKVPDIIASRKPPSLFSVKGANKYRNFQSRNFT